MQLLITWVAMTVGFWVAASVLKGMTIKGGVGSHLIVSAIFGTLVPDAARWESLRAEARATGRMDAPSITLDLAPEDFGSAVPQLAAALGLAPRLSLRATLPDLRLADEAAPKHSAMQPTTLSCSSAVSRGKIGRARLSSVACSVSGSFSPPKPRSREHSCWCRATG